MISYFSTHRLSRETREKEWSGSDDIDANIKKLELYPVKDYYLSVIMIKIRLGIIAAFVKRISQCDINTPNYVA